MKLTGLDVRVEKGTVGFIGGFGFCFDDSGVTIRTDVGEVDAVATGTATGRDGALLEGVVFPFFGPP